MSSYGAKTDVLNDWFGSPTMIYTPAISGTGAGVITGASPLVPTTWTAATSNKKYLMWKDTSAVVPGATDYTITGQIMN